MSRVLNLNTVLKDLGGVELDGVIYAVRGIKGRNYQALQAMERAKQVDLGELYRIAGECVPDLGDKVYDLTLDQIQAVIAAASGGVAEVAQTAPKATEPTATPETPPA